MIHENYDRNKAKRKRVLDELDALELEEESGFSITAERPKKEKKKKEKEKGEQKETGSDDEWLETFTSLKVKPEKHKKKSPYDVFELGSGKRKGKKRKKKDDIVDYEKEFSAETALYNNLMREQAKFTDALQKKYDAMELTKSSARGIGKFTTDLIASINSARDLTLRSIEKQANLKKTIAELNMKQKEKFGKDKSNGGEDLGLLGSSVLSKYINEARIGTGGGDYDIADMDMDDAYEEINMSVATEDDAEIDAYLRYESEKPTIFACINEASGQTCFIAKNKDNQVLDDYPLPEMTRLNINRSTNTATDTYSRKYPIIWQ